MSRQIAWAPQEGPQHKFVTCPLPEIFYGGARGGGKTDGVLGKYAIKAETYGEGFNALFCRRELPMLDDAIERSHQIFGAIGASWNEQKKTWRFPSGGRLRFRPLERTSDAEKYQGQNISDACIEEAGLYPDSKPIDRLYGVLRSASGVPTQLLMTGNPGGPGQLWIKARFVDPAPGGMKVVPVELPGGLKHKRIYIPSRLQHNKKLMEADPDYIAKLHLVGSEALVKAWLTGDWNAIEGAFFDCWNDTMILKPFKIPGDWARFVSGDWGSAKPFSIGWWAIVTQETRVQGRVLPRGALIRYREWYGRTGSPNVGLKLTADQVGEGIAERSLHDPIIRYGVMDPAAFSEDGGPSIMERLVDAQVERGRGFHWDMADNKRVGNLGHMGGWDQLRQRIKENMIFVFDTCADSIRTIPVLQHDDARPEDLDTSAEDHAADEWRYACMSRPLPAGISKPKLPNDAKPTLNDMLKRQKPIIKSKRI